MSEETQAASTEATQATEGGATTTQAAPADTTSVQTGGGTILGGGTATPTAVGTNTGVQEATAPDWKTTLPKDIAEDPSLVPITSIESLAKSYVHGQRLIGSDKIVVPGQYATDEEWRTTYQKLGCPETPDAYELSLPNDAQVDDKLVGDFKNIAHKAGLNTNQLQQVVEWYTNASNEAATTMSQQNHALLQDQEKSLSNEWGQASEKNTLAAATAVSELAPQISGLENFLNEATIDGVPAGDHPMMRRIFYAFGKNFMDDEIQGRAKQVTGFTQMSPEEATRKIAEMQADPNGAYRDKMHPGHKQAVDEMHKLFIIKNGGKAEPISPRTVSL